MEKQRYTLAVLVDNEAGVSSQVSRLFARKGYNIESLAVGTTDDPTVSRMTIEVLADNEAQVRLLCNQLRKLFPVHTVKLLAPAHSVRRELVLVKVGAETPAVRNEIIQLANVFRANVIDVTPEALTIAVIGEEGKNDALMNLIELHGIKELVRTGVVALERGGATIDEDTKVKDEFDYGKNVR